MYTTQNVQGARRPMNVCSSWEFHGNAIRPAKRGLDTKSSRSRLLLMAMIWFATVSIASAAWASWEEWEFDGDPVAYRLDGSGPPVVQVHGIGAGASSLQTRYQIDALVDAGYSVYSIDLTGWGRSIGPQRLFTGPYYANLVSAFLDEVVAEPAGLVGHSLGGTYVIAAAAQRPDLTTALVLNAPVGVESFTRESNRASARLWQGLVETAVGRAFYRALGSWASIAGFCRTSLYVDPSFCDLQTLYDYRQNTRQPDSIYAAAAFLTGNLGLDVRDEFASLNKPILLIWGDQSAFTPLSEAEAFIELNDNARLEVIEDAGALVNDERQDEFDALMLEVFEGATMGGSDGS